MVFGIAGKFPEGRPQSRTVGNEVFMSAQGWRLSDDPRTVPTPRSYTESIASWRVESSGAEGPECEIGVVVSRTVLRIAFKTSPSITRFAGTGHGKVCN